MNKSSYKIKHVSQSRPESALEIGNLRGLQSFLIPSKPKLFILHAAGKYYTIEYAAVQVNEETEYDELNEFIEVIRPFLIWDLVL